MNAAAKRPMKGPSSPVNFMARKSMMVETIT